MRIVNFTENIISHKKGRRVYKNALKTLKNSKNKTLGIDWVSKF